MPINLKKHRKKTEKLLKRLKLSKGLNRYMILLELSSRYKKLCAENDKKKQKILKLKKTHKKECFILETRCKNLKIEIAKCGNRTRRFKNELGERGIYA